MEGHVPNEILQEYWNTHINKQKQTKQKSKSASAASRSKWDWKSFSVSSKSFSRNFGKSTSKSKSSAAILNLNDPRLFHRLSLLLAARSPQEDWIKPETGLNKIYVGLNKKNRGLN